MTSTILPAGTSASIAFEEAHELLMAVALHVAADEAQRTGSWCHGACSRASWCRAGPSSAAGPAGCDREPGFGSSRRAKARWRGPADRHRARPRRAACRRSSDRSKSLIAITVRLKPVRLPDAPDRAGADAARPCHQYRRSNGWSRPADRQASAPPRARPPQDRAEDAAEAASCRAGGRREDLTDDSPSSWWLGCGMGASIKPLETSWLRTAGRAETIPGTKSSKFRLEAIG